MSRVYEPAGVQAVGCYGMWNLWDVQMCRCASPQAL